MRSFLLFWGAVFGFVKPIFYNSKKKNKKFEKTG